MNTSAIIYPNVSADYPDYLRDESRKTGTADSISFPCCEQEISQLLTEMTAQRIPVTVQGSRTGITAGAIPNGGHILNLSRMNHISPVSYTPEGTASVTVQPGVILSELRDSISDHFFPPDPTETSASIGGMVSCNASGACAYLYGPTRKWVRSIRVVLADGSILQLQRGEQQAAERHFSLHTESARTITGALPSYTMPNVKNAAGLYVQDNMDLIDLFIGSEGTLGIISEIELAILPAITSRWGLMMFFPNEESAIKSVIALRALPTQPAAIEFFDSNAIDLLRQQRAANSAFADLPELPTDWHTALYIENHCPSEDCAEQSTMTMAQTMTECGGNEDATWLASDHKELTRLKDFRHAIPEAVNLQIDHRRKEEPQLTKLGTDLAVPDQELRASFDMYRAGLSDTGLQHVIFGHIGNNHVHVNIIPSNMSQYQQGKELYLQWARKVVDMGGTVSAEHGIGKIKKNMLAELYGQDGLQEMKSVKNVFDPLNIINPDNVF